MSTADHTAADSPAPRGDAAGRMTIPLAILPAPVPPALIRSRPPHPSIPQTKPQRTALLEAIRRGLHERPAVPPPDLALRPDQLVRVREFVVAQRARKPIAIVDAYYDGEGKALCPMAAGITHHVGPSGFVEPCPIIQLAVDDVRSGSFYETVTRSAFLRRAPPWRASCAAPARRPSSPGSAGCRS